MTNLLDYKTEKHDQKGIRFLIFECSTYTRANTEHSIVLTHYDKKNINLKNKAEFKL